MNKEKFSSVYIDNSLPSEIRKICVSYFEDKVDLVNNYNAEVDLVICTSTNFINKTYKNAFVIFDNTEFDDNIQSKYFYNPGEQNLNFFKVWLDRNFKSLNIPFLTKNPYQTILLIH